MNAIVYFHFTYPVPCRLTPVATISVSPPHTQRLLAQTSPPHRMSHRNGSGTIWWAALRSVATQAAGIGTILIPFVLLSFLLLGGT